MNDLLQRESLVFATLAGEHLHGLELDTAPRILCNRFVSHFGVPPFHCAWLWLCIEEALFNQSPFSSRTHLSWTSNLLKTDDTEHQMKGRWGCDEKTFRKWLHSVLDVVSDLDMASLVALA